MVNEQFLYEILSLIVRSFDDGNINLAHTELLEYSSKGCQVYCPVFRDIGQKVCMTPLLLKQSLLSAVEVKFDIAYYML